MPARRKRMTMSTDGSATPGLYRLLAWSSPAFPVGAFSYSHGLEAAAGDGAVRDRDSLQRWVGAIVLRGGGRVDADILRDAHRAVKNGDDAALVEANRRGVAYRATAELALESGQQGESFVAAWRNAWCAAPHPDPLPAGGERESDAKQRTVEGVFAGENACHAAACGAAAASAGTALEDALVAYLHAFAGNLVSAGMRLGIVGQTDGQRILAALEPEIATAVTGSMSRTPAEFGGATFAADLASMTHETQYTRLFRS